MASRGSASDPLRFAIAPSNAGPFGDPKAATELARAAEEAGWDGYFSWDALPMRPDPPPAYDPWVILSAVAMVTTRMKIGTCVAVVPRYKPHLLARTLVSLDVLSGGRVIFGVGLGGDGGASIKAFGENAATRARAQKTDEALEIITRLWSEDLVTYQGEHYMVDGFTLSARPVQQPRIPIWVGGDSPAALRRAARWDGWLGPSENPLESSPEDVRTVCGRLDAEPGASPLDIAWSGTTGDRDDSVTAYRDAGATWWIEVLLGTREQMLSRVAAGPPKGSADT